MKIYKYAAMSVCANIDPYVLYNNICENYKDINFYNPFNSSYMGKKDDPALHPLDGIKINKLFSGNTITKQEGIDCDLQLDVNIEIFSERCVVMTEFIFDIKSKDAFDVMVEKIKDNFIFEDVLSWKTNEGALECSIISFSNEFLMKKLFPFHTDEDLKKIFKEIDPTEKKDALKWREQVKQKIGLNVDLCGSRGMSTNSSNWDTSIVLDEDKQLEINDSHEKISDEYEIYYSKSLDANICFDKEILKKLRFNFKNHNLFETIITGYVLSLQMWSYTINKETEDLIPLLDSKNEVYWQNLRMKIEEWQLHFLSQNAKRSASLSKIHQTNTLNFNTFNKETRDQWLDYLSKKEKAMERYVDEVKYNLNNISTPGHTHDEQALQRESETTNERILLLSFLAMSIPMLGAIFSPAFTINTKIISASVLLFLPILYFSIFRLSKKRQNKLDAKRDFNRQRKHLQQYVSYHEDNIKEIKNDDKLADDVKKNIIEWEEENINIGLSMLAKIEKKLK